MRLDAQQPRRVGEHRPRVRFGEARALQHIEEDLGLLPRHRGVVRPLRRRVAEIAVAVDHLLRRAARDAELQPPAGDEVGGAGVLGHVERVLVAHVDDRRAELDPLGPRPARREQRKRRAELPGEMMHPEIGAVGAQRLRRHRQLDRLQKCIRRRARLRLRRRGPVPEGKEADVFHGRAVGAAGLAHAIAAALERERS